MLLEDIDGLSEQERGRFRRSNRYPQKLSGSDYKEDSALDIEARKRGKELPSDLGEDC